VGASAGRRADRRGDPGAADQHRADDQRGAQARAGRDPHSGLGGDQAVAEPGRARAGAQPPAQRGQAAQVLGAVAQQGQRLRDRGHHRGAGQHHAQHGGGLRAAPAGQRRGGRDQGGGEDHPGRARGAQHEGACGAQVGTGEQQSGQDHRGGAAGDAVGHHLDVVAAEQAVGDPADRQRDAEPAGARGESGGAAAGDRTPHLGPGKGHRQGGAEAAEGRREHDPIRVDERDPCPIAPNPTRLTIRGRDRAYGAVSARGPR
jgi:hypothetical protein